MNNELDAIAHAIHDYQPTGTSAVLVGWISVAEFLDANGNRWLTIRSGAAAGSEHITTSWQRRGYLSEVLQSDWLDEDAAELIEGDPDE